jgi:hypothetical protein
MYIAVKVVQYSIILGIILHEARAQSNYERDKTKQKSLWLTKYTCVKKI